MIPLAVTDVWWVGADAGAEVDVAAALLVLEDVVVVTAAELVVELVLEDVVVTAAELVVELVDVVLVELIVLEVEVGHDTLGAV